MRESTIEKAVCKYARDAGILQYKFTSPGNSGVPDRIFISPRGIFFVEFKAPGKVPTKLQEHIHKILRGHGAKVYVVDGIEAGRGLVDAYA